MKGLLKKVEARKNVTEGMIDDLNKIAEFLIQCCEKMKDFPIIAGEWQVQTKTSNVGSWTCLTHVNDYGGSRILPTSIERVGVSTYLHGDFSRGITFMDRDEVIELARNIGKILVEFEKYVVSSSWIEKVYERRLQKLTAVFDEIV
jgi:hypothetical protein